ncbi:MAG: sigma-70 family RNA polymerase sigma factor [Candidatus Aminicenantes bacterium]|nr:sigma-70 family RNA polymerase sigma factor [Candidatus Aminicenantes bacterium]
MPEQERTELDIGAAYDRYGPMVFRRCLQLLRDEEKARDAMQEVFVRLLAHRDRLSGRYPSSLLFRIATNVCLNLLRARKIRAEEPGSEALETIAASDESEHRTVLGDLVDRLFRREKASTREIAVMLYVDGMTLKEAARETGLSVSGVRKRIREFRARALAQGRAAP